MTIEPGSIEPDSIEPDSKDWTWVLDRPCPECGLDTRTITAREVPGLVRDNAAAWLPVLAKPDARQRPAATSWSALEYGAHVRDVFRLYDTRLHLMLNHDDPLFPNWDQDVTAVEERYAEQDPAVVAIELAEAAETVARSFEAVRDDQLSRAGRRSDGASFTIETFGRYFVHDPVHHMHDVSR